VSEHLIIFNYRVAEDGAAIVGVGLLECGVRRPESKVSPGDAFRREKAQRGDASHVSGLGGLARRTRESRGKHGGWKQWH
jgi:hypothetical protein